MLQLIGVLAVVYLCIGGLVQAFSFSPVVGAAFVGALLVGAVSFARDW